MTATVHRLPIRPRAVPASSDNMDGRCEFKIGTLGGSVQIMTVLDDGSAVVFQMSPEEAIRLAGRLEINAVLARMGLPHGDI